MSTWFLAQTDAATGGSLASLLVPVLLFVAMYVLLIRPQRARQKAQARLLEQLAVGDRVMTIGGIYGTIVGVQDDEGTLDVEIASGVRVSMVRQGIRERIVEPGADAAADA